jgi:hypothetical protein
MVAPTGMVAKGLVRPFAKGDGHHEIVSEKEYSTDRRREEEIDI